MTIVERPAAVTTPAPSPAAAPTPVRRRWRLVRPAHVFLLLLADVTGIILAFGVAYWLRALTEQRPSRISPLEAYLPSLDVLIVALVVTFFFMRLYVPRRGASRIDLLGTLCVAVTIGNGAALALAAFSLRGLDVPRIMLVFAWVLAILFVWALRTLVEEAMRLARRVGLDPHYVLIVGGGEEGRLILAHITSAPELGYRPVGFVDDRPRSDSLLPVIGSLGELPELLRRYGVTEVVVADSGLSHGLVVDIVQVCDRARVSVQVFPDVFHLILREVSVSEFGGLPMLKVRDVNLRGWNLLLKRGLDIVLATVLLVVLAPLLVGIALAVKLTSRGPAFFVQERIGIDGRPFPCVKYRSMRMDAETRTGPVWAAPDDDRTTKLGRFMRRYSVDELPQLVNVLLGDMSLVGPRPERPHFVEQFSQLIPRYDQRHQEKAGVTGWAQVNGLRGQTSIEERTRYDLFYVEHWSPAFDLKILFKTITAVIRGRNAY